MLNLLVFFSFAYAEAFVRKDFVITLRDGTKLDCSKFIPDSDS